MRIVPDSTVALYRDVDIDMVSGVQIAFSSLANQNAYFASKLVMPEVTCTVVKKTGRIRLQVAGSVVKNCNYISFINPSFDNKRIYARILDYDYINNECTEIAWQIDFWQTWMFDIDFETCHIDREHLSETEWGWSETNPYDQRIMEYLTPENNLACNKMLEKNYYSQDDVYILDGDPNNGFATYMGYLIVASTINMSYLDSSASDWMANRPSTMFKNLFKAILNQDESTLGTATELGFIYSNDFWGSEIEGGATSDPDYKLKFSLSFTQPNIKNIFDYTDVTGFNNTLISDTGTELSKLGNPFNIYWVGRNGAQQIVDLYTQCGASSCILSIVEMPFVYFAGMFERSTETQGRYIEHLVETMKTSYYRVNANNKYDASMRKLYTFPFSYMRVVATNNDVKEYHYEDFNGVANGGSDCDFGISTTPIGSTEIVCKPLGYKYSYNMQDNLYLRDFPQIPYTTDAFVSYMASVAMSIISNNTLDTQDQIGLSEISVKKGYAGVIASGLAGAAQTGGGLATGNAGNVASGVGTLATVPFNIKDKDLARSLQDRAVASTQDAYNVLMGANEAADFGSRPGQKNAIYENYDATKPAYAMNLYKGASTGYGIYNKDVSFYPRLTLIHVQLRDEILKKYNDYFKCYGYTSGRFGIPRVINYVIGNHSNDDVPHWIDIDGNDTTFIKTADLHVKSSMLPVSVAIEGMFNSGVRMLKGETL